MATIFLPQGPDTPTNVKIANTAGTWKAEWVFMGVYYHQPQSNRELSPQLGLFRQITPKYEKIKKI